MVIGVLASGKGSNLRVIIESIKSGSLPVDIGIVLSDNPEAGALKIAKEKGVKALYVPPGRHKTFLEKEVEKKYVSALKEAKVELVCLSGFMRVIKEEFFSAFSGKILNIHPALLPAFPGLQAWKQAIEAGVKFSGCTVHFVERDVDAGPIIMQAVVPVEEDDTPETLHHRIQKKEHIIYPLSIKLFAENRLRIKGKRVTIL